MNTVIPCCPSKDECSIFLLRVLIFTRFNFSTELELCGGFGEAPSNYTDVLLCCLRSIYKQGCAPPLMTWNHKVLSTLIQYGYAPPTNQECVANILANACKVSCYLSILYFSERQNFAIEEIGRKMIVSEIYFSLLFMRHQSYIDS